MLGRVKSSSRGMELKKVLTVKHRADLESECWRLTPLFQGGVPPICARNISPAIFLVRQIRASVMSPSAMVTQRSRNGHDTNFLSDNFKFGLLPILIRGFEGRNIVLRPGP